MVSVDVKHRVLVVSVDVKRRVLVVSVDVTHHGFLLFPQRQQPVIFAQSRTLSKAVRSVEAV